MESKNTPDSTQKPQKIIQTDQNATTGQNKCTRCGSTDLSLNPKTGTLRCNFCRFEFSGKKITGFVEDLTQLEGEIIGSGSQEINQDSQDTISLKCQSCGAEVVVNTKESTQSRCHWCRNTLSINHQLPNGAVPDSLLPFKLTKQEAEKHIQAFVKKRQGFAHPKFKKEFTTENIMGVYFPYLIIDANTSVSLEGEGEHQTRSYKINDSTYYDADLYHITREFDLTISDLTVESSSNRLDHGAGKTNNIINSIMPFDTENCIHYDSNFLKGYTSERRDLNIDQIRQLVESQTKDIARFAANDSLKNYDRGVRWDKEDLKIKGQQWQSAYLPVWLYSYQEIKGKKSLLHYVAVNARTAETMGSVPIHFPKLFLVSSLFELFGIGFFLYLADIFEESWIGLSFGFLYFFFIYLRYRNSNARHSYEKETKTNLTNLKTTDTFIRKLKRLRSSHMNNANNTKISGSSSLKPSAAPTLTKIPTSVETLPEDAREFIKNNDTTKILKDIIKGQFS